MEQNGSSATFHKTGYGTGYELAAINVKTNERIFICFVSGSKSRGVIARTLHKKLKSGETRLEAVCRLTNTKPAEWEWAKKAGDGCIRGDWQIKFTHRTGRDLDREGTGPSIYDDSL